MAVAYSSTGTAASGNSGSLSVAHSAASGADVFLGLLVDRNVTPTSIAYNGVTATLVGSQVGNNNGAFGGVVYVYRAAAAGTGSSKNWTGTIPSSWWVGQSVSYTGVSSVGSPAYTYGQSTSPSTSSVSLTTGQLAIGFVGTCDDGQVSTLGSPTGGTNRYLLGVVPGDSGGGSAGLIISDATSTATFAGTVTGSAPCWATVAVVLSPPAGLTPTTASVTIMGSTPSIGLTVNPSGPTVTVTAGTPTVTAATGATIFPLSASISITTSTPSISSPKVVTPASATVGVTCGTPGVARAYGPLARVVNNLTLGQSTTIMVVGDSTAWGTDDAEQTTLFGWGGRLGLALGKYYGANVRAFATQYPSSSSYGSAVSVYSGAGGSAPMITVYIAAWPGGTWGANLLPSEALWLSPANPDVFIIGEGFNETNTTTYTTNYVNFINNNSGNDIQTLHPGIPVVVTTQNRTTIPEESGHFVLFTSIFSALMTTFLGGASLPLSPPLQPSTVSGVWVLDTQQAIAPTDVSTYISGADGLHPIDVGYQKQALWMLSQLAPASVGTLTPATATVTLTGGTAVLSNGLTTVVAPASAAVVITTTTASTSLTAKSLISPAAALVTITGAPGLVFGGGLTVRAATASVLLTGGVPTVVIVFPAINTPSSRTITAPVRGRAIRT